LAHESRLQGWIGRARVEGNSHARAAVENSLSRIRRKCLGRVADGGSAGCTEITENKRSDTGKGFGGGTRGKDSRQGFAARIRGKESRQGVVPSKLPHGYVSRAVEGEPEQNRSRTGAEPEQNRSRTGAESEQNRSRVGAEPGSSSTTV
jgi:hypothetical protein